MKILNRRTTSLFMATAAFAGMAGKACALDEVYSPNAEYHELSVEYNGSRTFDNDPSKNNAQEHELAIEAGLAPGFPGENSAGFERDPASDNPTTKMTDFEVEGRYQ